MADYINLQQAEYSEVQTNLKKLHETLINAEEDIRKKFLDLSSANGGFYVESVSEKIEYLLDELKTGPITQLNAVLTLSEQTITFF